MNKLMIIAKIRRWQAELNEMITTLNAEGKGGPIIGVLHKRARQLDDVIETIRDESWIPSGQTPFEPEPVLEEMEEKVKKVKQGVKKIRRLSREKKRILKDLEAEG